MPNYQKGIVYKLCCNDLSIKDIYIGSTTSFRKRKYTHKGSCNDINAKNYNSKVYKFIRDNGGFKNWSMILIAETASNSKLELNKHERYYYEKFSASLNIPSLFILMLSKIFIIFITKMYYHKIK